MHLFDPAGKYLFSGEGGNPKISEEGEGEGEGESEGVQGEEVKVGAEEEVTQTTTAKPTPRKKKKNSREGKPVARRYGLNDNNIFTRFPDQFEPFVSLPYGVAEAFSNNNEGNTNNVNDNDNNKKFFKGTIFRICLRKENSGVFNRKFTDERVLKMVTSLKKKAITSFLFTRNLCAINIDSWASGSDVPQVVLRSRLRTSPNVRSNHMTTFSSNNEWKKGGKFSSFFKGGWAPIKATQTLEISYSTGSGESTDNGETVDTFMITSILAPLQIVKLASRPVLVSLNLLPVVRLAAHIHRSKQGCKKAFKLSRGTLFANGFDTGIKTGLPVFIQAPFFLNEFDREVDVKMSKKGKKS